MLGYMILDSYARESAAGDKRKTSIGGQHQVNLRRIEELGAALGERLDDQGKSAWKPGIKREAWEIIIARLDAGKSDGVVIFDIERFLRRVEDAVRIVKLADRGFVIYDSDMEYDLNTPSGRKAFYDQAVGAEAYSHRLSSKVRRGNRQKAIRGEGRRGRYRPFGFEDDGTTVRESERPYAQEVVRMILSGRMWKDAIEYLHDNGVYSTGQNHTPECVALREDLHGIKYRQYSCDCPRREWSVESLRGAILAPRMAGYVKLGRKEILGKLPGEPIIDATDWQSLLALVESRRGRQPLETLLCSGKDSPIRCGNCGGYLAAQLGVARKKKDDTVRPALTYADGSLMRHYRCHKGCGKTIADCRALDKAISAMVVDRLSSPQAIEQIRRHIESIRSKRAPHEKEIVRIESLVQHWDERLNAGNMSPDRYRVLVADLDKRKAEQMKLLADISEDVPKTVPEGTMDDIAREWEAATPAMRRERLRQAYSGYHILVIPGSSKEEDVRYRIGKPTPIQPE
jgi:DNA invertase Pin-like site-specific DNA recombinase